MNPTPAELIANLLQNQARVPQKAYGEAFAPSNIALCKYWGKRDDKLNLPLTNSLSISLGGYGARTRIFEIEGGTDQIWINHQPLLDRESSFATRLRTFLDGFRPSPHTYYQVETEINIPIAAGLASSACGFAALVRALADLYQWTLEAERLSILARLGSGSACRSLWSGFVEWEKGERADGLDSHGLPLAFQFPKLRLGLWLLDQTVKPISSRLAMKNTRDSSRFFSKWPDQVQADLQAIKSALQHQDFELLGKTAESNALTMHALMMTANPPIVYMRPETLAGMQAIWQYRAEGLSLYFTEDAGPNLKLLFLESERETIQKLFPHLTVVEPFNAHYLSSRIEDEQAV